MIQQSVIVGQNKKCHWNIVKGFHYLYQPIIYETAKEKRPLIEIIRATEIMQKLSKYLV